MWCGTTTGKRGAEVDGGQVEAAGVGAPVGKRVGVMSASGADERTGVEGAWGEMGAGTEQTMNQG